MSFDNFSEYEKILLVNLFQRVLCVDELKEGDKNRISEILRVKINCKRKFKLSSKSDEEIINYFSKKDNKIKKIIYYNLLYFCLHYDTYSLKQYEYLHTIEKSFMILDNTRKNIYRLVYEKIDIENKIKEYLN